MFIPLLLFYLFDLSIFFRAKKENILRGNKIKPLKINFKTEMIIPGGLAQSGSATGSRLSTINK